MRENPFDDERIAQWARGALAGAGLLCSLAGTANAEKANAQTDAQPTDNQSEIPAHTPSDYQPGHIGINFPSPTPAKAIEEPLFELNGGVGLYANSRLDNGLGAHLRAGKTWYTGGKNGVDVGFVLEPGVDGSLYYDVKNEEIAGADIDVSAISLFGVRSRNEKGTVTENLSLLTAGAHYINNPYADFNFLGASFVVFDFSVHGSLTNGWDIVFDSKFLNMEFGEGNFFGRNQNTLGGAGGLGLGVGRDLGFAHAQGLFNIEQDDWTHKKSRG